MQRTKEIPFLSPNILIEKQIATFIAQAQTYLQDKNLFAVSSEPKTDEIKIAEQYLLLFSIFEQLDAKLDTKTKYSLLKFLYQKYGVYIVIDHELPKAIQAKIHYCYAKLLELDIDEKLEICDAAKPDDLIQQNYKAAADLGDNKGIQEYIRILYLLAKKLCTQAIRQEDIKYAKNYELDLTEDNSQQGNKALIEHFKKHAQDYLKEAIHYLQKLPDKILQQCGFLKTHFQLLIEEIAPDQISASMQLIKTHYQTICDFLGEKPFDSITIVLETKLRSEIANKPPQGISKNRPPLQRIDQANTTRFFSTGSATVPIQLIEKRKPEIKKK